MTLEQAKALIMRKIEYYHPSWGVYLDGRTYQSGDNEKIVEYMRLNYPDFEIEEIPIGKYIGVATKKGIPYPTIEEDSGWFGDILSYSEFNKILSSKELDYKLALEEIVDPIKFMRERLEEGYRLNGSMAIQMADSANYLKEIARKALKI